MSFDPTLFDPTIPIERARTPPSAWYLDPACHELERKAVFGRRWQAVARSDQLERSGDYASGCFAGEPWVVLRDGDALRAFFNVCRHHASGIVEGEGNAARLVCPYHGWTYDLDGRLRKAPRMAGVRDFDRDALGLLPLRVGTLGPIVFVNASAEVPDLERTLGPLAGRIDFTGLRFVARRTYDLECNWKVFVDNYLDGGYHVEHLHRGLAGQLDLGSYHSEIGDWVSLQTCGSAGAGEALGDFGARLGAGAVYAFVYPNFMLNRYGPILDTNLVLPLGPGRTRVVFDYWFEEAAAADADFVERSLAASDRVQLEDVGVCEAVQRGLGSSAYDVGLYAPQVERAMHHFHRLLAADLRDGDAGSG